MLASSLKNVDRWMAEMDRAFGRVSNHFDSLWDSGPAINMWTDEDKIVLAVSVPGVEAKDVSIQAVGQTLTISGQWPNRQNDSEKVVRQELPMGQFERKVRLPYTIENAKIDARTENGVLMVVVERPEESKPRTVEVREG